MSTGVTHRMKDATGASGPDAVDSAAAAEAGRADPHVHMSTVLKLDLDTGEAYQQLEIYWRLFDILPDAILIHCEGRVTYVNRAAMRMWGATAPESLIGNKSIDLISEDSRSDVIAFREEVTRTGIPVEIGSYRILRLDGTEGEVEGYCAPFTGLKKPALMSVIRDLSELRQTEHMLQSRITELEETRDLLEKSSAAQIKLNEELRIAKEEADAANRTKSEFLATMSHELRTPLNAIIGFSDILKSQILGPEASEKYCEYANDIHNSGQHLLALINDILDLSKVEAGQEELHEEHIVIPDLIRSITSLVRQRASQKGIGLETEISRDLPSLYADKRKLKQIFINLLTNAIKFTEAGGKVTFSAWCRRESGYVFQIVDTGIGIAPADIPKALSKFGQVDSDINRRHEGTGLGLPLTKELIELHGGSLDLQSVLGKGTTVTVRFPATRIGK